MSVQSVLKELEAHSANAPYGHVGRVAVWDAAITRGGPWTRELELALQTVYEVLEHNPTATGTQVFAAAIIREQHNPKDPSEVLRLVKKACAVANGSTDPAVREVRARVIRHARSLTPPIPFTDLVHATGLSRFYLSQIVKGEK